MLDTDPDSLVERNSMDEKPLTEIIRENIVYYREQAGMSQLDFGLALDYKHDNAQTRISQYEIGVRSPNKRTLQLMAAILRVSIDQLTGLRSNVEHAYRKHGRLVPVISWVRAGELHEPQDLLQPGISEGEPVSSSTNDPDVFALRVVGHSMEPEFHEGEVIVVSPAVEPQHGEYCVVKIGNEVTFKQILFTLKGLVFKSLNPDYPDITVNRTDKTDVKVLGKVIEKVKRY